MPVSVIQRNVKLKHRPANGLQAHQCLIQAIKDEISELQTMLSELSNSEVRQQFISEWNPHITSVAVRD